MRSGPNARGTPPRAWVGGQPPPIVHEYVQWLISLERVPPTKAAWCELHDVGLKTTQGWDNDDRVDRLLNEYADKLNMSPARVQRVMNALYKKASSGDTNAAKIYMAHVDKIMPRKPPEPLGLEGASDEELREELARHGLLPDG